MSAYDEKYLHVIFKPIQTDAFKTFQQFVKPLLSISDKCTMGMNVLAHKA